MRAGPEAREQRQRGQMLRSGIEAIPQVERRMGAMGRERDDGARIDENAADSGIGKGDRVS